MDYNSFTESQDESPEDYNASGDSSLGKSLKNYMHENNKHKQTSSMETPFRNKDVETFIEQLGFKSEQLPRFSEIAKKLNLPILHEETKKDLTTLDEHDVLDDVKHIQKDDSSLDIKKQALRRLIAKYKG